MNLLTRIDNLQTALKEAANEVEMAGWWSEYNTIKYQVEDDKSANKYERDAVERLGMKLTEFMAAIRDKLPSPNRSAVAVSLGALRGSIAARTVGQDGYKMK